MTRFLSRRRARHDRGAVAVEAALLLPIFILLIMGIFEWALVVRDSTAVTDSSRVGARTASAMPHMTGLTQATVDAIGRAGSALPKSSIDFVLVYKANDRGYPGIDGSTTMSCSGAETTCDKFTWDGAAFVPTAGTTWNALNVNACATPPKGPPDSVGVYVQATHRFVTGLFGGSRTIQDRSVLRFEPLQNNQCEGTP